MPALTYPKDQSRWLRWETGESYTRNNGTLTAGQGDMVSGSIMLDTDGTYTKVDPATVTGTSKLVILLTDIVDDGLTDQDVAVLENGPVLVVGSELGYFGADTTQTATINTALKAANIKVV